MFSHLKHRSIRFIILVAAELTLNWLGMDTLANFGEFVFGQEITSAPSLQPAITLCIPRSNWLTAS